MNLTIPVIVIGPPRSGTSTASKIMQKYFGVKMTDIQIVNEWNPDGYFEDMDLIVADSQFVANLISEDTWKDMFEQFIIKMRKFGGPWGFKDPRQCAFFDLVLERFPAATVIRCQRQRSLVLKSSMKHIESFKGKNKKESNKMIQNAEDMLDIALSNFPHIMIKFDKKRRDDEQIANDILGQLEVLND